MSPSPSPKNTDSPPLHQVGLSVRRKLVGKPVRGVAPNAPLRKIRKKKGRVAGERVLKRFVDKVVESNRQRFPQVVKRVMENVLSRSHFDILHAGLEDLSVEIGLICHEEMKEMTTKSIEDASADINQYLTGCVQEEGVELIARLGDKFGLNHRHGFDDSDEDDSDEEGEYVLPDNDGSPDPFDDTYECRGRKDHVYTEICTPYVEMSGINQEEGVEIVVPAPVVTYYKTLPTTSRPVRPDTPRPSTSLEVCETSPSSVREESPSLLRDVHRISLSPALNCSGKRTSPESPMGSDRGVDVHSSSLRGMLGPSKMARKQGCSIGRGRDGFALDRMGNDVSRNCLPGGSYTQ